jgi:predicted nucleic acid-binding Zn ribbon protein
MSETLQTTGKVSFKRYQCKDCGNIVELSTNHYGEIYPTCRKCGWKHPDSLGQVHTCLEPVPSGWSVPKPWTSIKLNDLIKILGCTHH